jgi:SWI/SNF-related matrix-associated actin-dependent regulator 1 of chromatin subfamily A
MTVRVIETVDLAEQLHRATTILSQMCDGAHALDGAGFNKFDSPIGKSMSMTPSRAWSPGQIKMMYGILQKYRGQLLNAGFDFALLPKPDDVSQETQTLERKVSLVDNRFVISWGSRDPQFSDMLDDVRGIPGRMWHKDTKTNSFPVTRDVALLIKIFVKEYGDFKGNAQTHKAISDAINGEAKAAQPVQSRVIDLADNNFTLQFDFSHELLAAVRELPGRRWTGEINTLPHSYETVIQVLEFAKEFNFAITPAAQRKIDQIVKEGDVNLANSRAADSEFNVPELGLELYPFQRAGVEYLHRNRKTFLADEMGLGKTVQAIAAVAATNAYPAIVVCPASLKYNWQREVQAWVPGKSTLVVSGKKSKIAKADFIIINYDILKYHVEELRSMMPKTVICDESHYLKNYKSQRSKAADDLVKGTERGKGNRRLPNQYKVPHVFMLTGTPVLNRPSELLHPLSIMGKLDDFGGFWKFAETYCGAQQGYFGTDMGGAHNLEELNRKMRLYGLYIRRQKSQVLKELPPKVWATLPVQLSNRKEYERTLENTSRWFADQAIKDRDFLASLEGLSRQAREEAIREHHKSAEFRAAQAEQLTKIAALKQVAAQGKLQAIEEWIGDFLETEEKLVIFAHHTRIVKAIAEKFNAPAIMGETPAIKRQEYVDRFQNDPGTRVLVANIKAGGVGITLTAASNVLFVEFPWTPGDMDQAADRCHRIGQTDTVTAWQMVGIDTIDEKIVEWIAKKRIIVDAATEGKDVKGLDESMMVALIDWVNKDRV